MIQKKQPLRYKISAWSQLSKCLSNNSKSLHIVVSEFIQDSRLLGTRISVEHDEFGPLFTCLVNATGVLLSSNEKGVVPELLPSQILSELSKFGFLVTYNPITGLTSSQIEFLLTIKQLHFDKIRILSVYDEINSSKEYVVAFNSHSNGDWLNNAYSPSQSEFIHSIGEGTAFNISKINDKNNIYNWSWLYGFVANIDDVVYDFTHSLDSKGCE